MTKSKNVRATAVAEVRLARDAWKSAKTPAGQAAAWPRVEKAEANLRNLNSARR